MHLFRSIYMPDLEKVRQRAEAQTLDVTLRHDVTNDDETPEHLRDTEPRWNRTADGTRVTAKLTVQSILYGEESVAGMLMFFIVPTLLCMLALVSVLSTFLAFALLLAIIVVYHITSARGSGVFELMLIAGFAGAESLKAFSTSSRGAELSGMSGLGAYPTIFLILAALTFFRPILFLLNFKTERINSLISTSLAFSGESSPANVLMLEAHIPARAEQTEAAKRDKTPVLRFGTATGIISETSQDGYAPDRGLPVVKTLQDLYDTHLWSFGMTGTGKTTCVLRPVLMHWLEHNAGGALILDGKGTFGREAGTLPGVYVIHPDRTEFALIQNLNAEQVVAVFAKGGGGGSNGEFFVNSGANLLLKALIILEYASQCGEPAYKWHLAAGMRMVMDVEYRDAAVEVINASGKFDLELSGTSFLSSAIKFFAVEWPAMAKQTASGITGQVVSWVNPILSNRHLYKWASTDVGFDVRTVLTGEVVALDTPASLYDGAGVLAMQLAKAQVYRAIRQRDDNWRTTPLNGRRQTQVLVLIDEAQELISEADEGPLLAMGRSLGLTAVMASQSFEAVVAKFVQSGGSVQGAIAMLSNFKSLICFRASAGTIDYVRGVLGHNLRRRAVGKIDGIAFGAIAQSFADSGAYHPPSRLYRLMQRYGSPKAMVNALWNGVTPRSISGQTSDGGAAKTHANSDAQLQASTAQQAHNEKNKKGEFHAHDITTGFSTEVKPVVDIGEEMYLNGKFMAIVQLQNAGVPRRDFVKFEPMFSLTEGRRERLVTEDE